ncbi:MAG: shikimate dehydrogenase [Mesorhizobium sp.]|nr:shikimate dehydrogenase [Mesorhizobium sp.]
MAETSPKAFVVGHPITHSRSPLIHGHWLREYGLAGSYERVEIAPEAIASFLEGLASQGYAGGNVTLPHKEAAFAAVNRRDAAAEAIGAVNTVWLECGELHGSNTDAYGFAANLDEQAPKWREGRRACVLGAGGAARAILYALVEAGYDNIRLVNRNTERAAALAARFGAKIQPLAWEQVDRALADADLLVNTTSLGMGGSAFPEIELGLIDRDAIVTDIVYSPLETPLLRRADAAGFATADGLGMLLHQAVPAFERFFGTRPAVTPELRQMIVDDLEDAA